MKIVMYLKFNRDDFKKVYDSRLFFVSDIIITLYTQARETRIQFYRYLHNNIIFYM